MLVSEHVEKLVRRYEGIVREKGERLRAKGQVYAGRMVDGKWVPESLYDVWPGFGRVVELTKVVDDSGNVKASRPEPRLEDGLEFLGGTRTRAFYLNPAALERYPRLKAWFETKGDAHLLASMFTRPGKLARMKARLELPRRRVEDESHDGLLMTLSEAHWKALLKVYELPECTYAQVTVFDPEGVIAKGSVRRVLPGEEPTVFVKSWKWLEVDSIALHRSLSVLTVDSAYEPEASVNRQEYTYARYKGGRLAPWLHEEIRRAVEDVVVHERVSVDNVHGYLSAFGLPVPDSLTQDVAESQRNALYELLRRWPVSRRHGWRGKASMTSLVSKGQVLLPQHTQRYVGTGRKVWVGRNPALPMNGYVEMRVAGFVPGNVAYFSDMDAKWVQVLGGDVDGDDANILFRPPFEGCPYEYEVNLQAFKSTARALSSTSVEERLRRWENEVDAPIGKYDILARTAIDLGMADDEVLMDLTRLIQFAISLKKRDGKVEELETEAVRELRRSISPVVKPYAETQYLSNYATMSAEDRAHYRLRSMSEDMQTVLGLVEDGLEAVNLERARFTLAELKRVLAGVEFDDETLALAKQWHDGIRALIRSRVEADLDKDSDLAMRFNRELKMLTQVELPEYCLTLTDEAWKRFCAALAYRFEYGGERYWLWAVHPELLLEGLKGTFAKEKQMLFSSEGHELEEGDEVLVPALTRVVEAKGRRMRLSNGVVLVPEDTRFRVTKVYAKSVVIEPVLA